MKRNPTPAIPASVARLHNSAICAWATKVREATEWLIEQHKFSLEELGHVTAGRYRGRARPPGLATRLHKNSLMKIRQLRLAYTVTVINEADGDVDWVEDPTMRLRNHDGSKGVWRWLWNPQVDTLERLDRIYTQAKMLGFELPAPEEPVDVKPARAAKPADEPEIAKAKNRRSRKQRELAEQQVQQAA